MLLFSQFEIIFKISSHNVLYISWDNIVNLIGDVVPPSKSISRCSSQSSLTILGMQLKALPVKKTGYFSDKKEVQQSATALGYAAHVS